ncbi:MAG: hypothetical protein ACOX5M_10865 [Bacillota bacterium]
MVFPGKELKAVSDLESIETVALVGPSGTGKSHHAMTIAQEWSCEAIIDDGLLISGSRILAGRSAKREETKTAAIRRAIFSAPGHALEVREGLLTAAPKRVLILGTSVTMVDRIVSRLGLPQPREYLNITDFASKEEIDRALWQRRQEGKHVIPAPALEVKKTFSGYLVDPIRVFTRSRERYPVPERSVVRPTYSYFGRFYIYDSVVMQVAQRIAAEVPGVKRVLKVLVLTVGEGTVLDVELVLERGVKVFDVMALVQRRLKDRLEFLTGIYLEKIDVSTKKIGLE